MSCTVISQWIFSNHMFTYLWSDIYENLVVKTVGLNVFSLLGSSSSSSVDASSFGCVVILSLYLTLNFVISFVIFGTFKPACKTLLDIYTTEHLLLLGGLVNMKCSTAGFSRPRTVTVRLTSCGYLYLCFCCRGSGDGERKTHQS